MLSFEHIEYLLGLLALLPLVIVFILVLRWKRKTKKVLGDPELINAITGNYSSQYFNYKFVLFFLALAACVIAAANLRTPKASGGSNRAGIDIMVALDVSNSMLAQDVKPNRLERAKQVLNKLIEKLGNNRVGLVVFAGQAYLQMPLTSDLSAAKMYVANATPAAVPTQGTEIGAALRICNASLDTKEKKYKTVILMSDGEGHDEEAEEVIKQLADEGVVVHTIGFGSPEGSPIFDPATNDYKKDREGNTVISKLNQQELQMIAQQTGGSYHLFNGTDASVTQLLATLDQMEKKQIGVGSERVYSNYFQVFLLVAVLFLLLEVFIPERKMKIFG
ncbi:MAG: hypothetical protein JWQ96_758 [Segetibacter sp.]|nr:hypothetical protein [Segetibacter sp.]